jgi:hypothetical protein
MGIGAIGQLGVINYRWLVTDQIHIKIFAYGDGRRDQEYSQINGLRTLKGTIRPDYIGLRVQITIANCLGHQRRLCMFKKVGF